MVDTLEGEKLLELNTVILVLVVHVATLNKTLGEEVTL